MPQIEPIIKTKDLEIKYNEGKPNEFYATRKVTIDIYPEEYIVLFGPSGSGKSTLMYCFFGVFSMAVWGTSIHSVQIAV